MTQALVIGEGGLQILFRDKVENGAMLIVNFCIPGGEIASIRGEVRGSQGGEMLRGGWPHGVQFVGIQFHHKRLIRAFVAARPESEADL
jgi:hypothetical protein